MAQSVITIDATVGGVSSNSYLTEVEFENLIHQRPHHDVWDAIPAGQDDIKKAAMVWATILLDGLTWKGSVTDLSQALAWPRTGVYDREGRQILDNEIPLYIKYAQVEIALALHASDRLSDTGLEGFGEITVGPIKIKPDLVTKSGIIPEYVLRHLSILREGGRSIYNANVGRV